MSFNGLSEGQPLASARNDVQYARRVASLRGTKPNPIGETLSPSVLRLRTPQVRSLCLKPSARLTNEVKAKASSAVRNDDKAASLEARRAFTPKRH